MTDYLRRACDYLGVAFNKILAHRVSDDEVILVVDKGTEGAPKLSVPLSELESAPPKLAASKASEPEPETEAPAAVDYSGFKVAELRQMAKERGIATSGLKKADLIAALSE